LTLLPLLMLTCVSAKPSVQDIFGPELTSLESDHLLQIPTGWQLIGDAAPKDSMRLVFALKQRNPQKLEKTLYEVSDPSSPSYGRHLSLSALRELVEPTTETRRLVWLWLRANDIDACEEVETKDFWICETNVETAEKLLPGLRVMRFESASSSSTLLRSLRPYRVPSLVAPHLDFVGGVHRFPSKTGAFQRRRKARGGDAKAGFHLGTTPTVLRERYNLSSTDVGSNPKNKQMTAQFLEQYFHQTDVAEFMRIFVGEEFPHKTQVDKVVGPDPGGRARVEASLDVDYMMTTGANISTWFWSTPGRHESQEPFLEWLLAMSNTTDLPPVCSVSYSDYEMTLSKEYMQRVNQEFAKAGVRGISILFASGDNGAGCKETTHDHYIYNPMFPSSSPFVTTIGGTVFDNPFEIVGENTDFISGGGFSTVFARPSYQEAAVAKFLATAGKALPDAHYYNPNGRAFPDLAALSDNYWIVANRIPTPYISGTSCSTPVWAGIIGLINDVRLSNNKTALGFLNPMIYSRLSSPGAGLTDIVKGCHVGCLDSETLEGFCAQEGWDPTTGWGVPDYKTLIKTMLTF